MSVGDGPRPGWTREPCGREVMIRTGFVRVLAAQRSGWVRRRGGWPAEDRSVDGAGRDVGPRAGRARGGLRQLRGQELAPGGVVPTQGAVPDEQAGLGPGDRPAGTVLHPVVVMAERAQVDPHGGAAGPVVVAVVDLAGVGGVAADACEGAGAVADLGVAAQRCAEEPVGGACVEVGEVAVAVGVLGRDVGHHPAPDPARGRVGDQRTQQRLGNVQFDDPARRAVAAESGRAAARAAFRDQGSVRAGDGEPPLGAVLQRDAVAGVGSDQKAEAGDLGGMLVEPEQCGQADPDLDPDPLIARLVRGAAARPRPRAPVVRPAAAWPPAARAVVVRPPAVARSAAVRPVVARPAVAGPAVVRTTAAGGSAGRLIAAAGVVVSGGARGLRAGRTRRAITGDQIGDDLLAAHPVETAVEQAEEQIAPDLPDPPRMPGPLRRRRPLLDPFARRFGLVGRQAVGGDRDRAVLRDIGVDVAVTDAAPIPARGRLRVDRDHHPPQQARQLPGGQFRRPRHRHPADPGDLLGGQPGEVPVEHVHPGPVHRTGRPGREQLGHPVDDGLGEVVLGVRGVAGPAQGGPRLGRRVSIGGGGAADPAGSGDTRAAAQLGQRRGHPRLLVAQLAVLGLDPFQHAVVGHLPQRHRVQGDSQPGTGRHRRQPPGNLRRPHTIEHIFDHRQFRGDLWRAMAPARLGATFGHSS